MQSIKDLSYTFVTKNTKKISQILRNTLKETIWISSRIYSQT